MRKLQILIYDIKHKLGYPERNLKFIWGIISCATEASLYQANDIDIVYDKKTKKYMLGVETTFFFKNGKAGECRHLKHLLSKFTEYMVENNLDTKSKYCFYCSSLTIPSEASTIEDLYTNFSIFVNGYCALYEMS